jgi:hypothetical protein
LEVFEVKRKGFVSFLKAGIFSSMIVSALFFSLVFSNIQEEFVRDIERNCPRFDAFHSCFGKTMPETIGILGKPTDIVYIPREDPSCISFLTRTGEGNYSLVAEGFRAHKLLLALVYVLDREKIYLFFSPKKETGEDKEGEEVVKAIIFRGLRDPVPFDRIFKEISN